MNRTKYKNAWRKKHLKIRNKCRKANYSKSKPAIRKNRPWTLTEIDMVQHRPCDTDTHLSNVINRSVQAIQQKRYMIKKGKK